MMLVDASGMRILTESQCIGCGCTESHACEGGCAWVDADQTLCSRCFANMQVANELAPAAVARTWPREVQFSALDRELGARRVYKAIEFAQSYWEEDKLEYLWRLVAFEDTEGPHVGFQEIEILGGAVNGNFGHSIAAEHLDALIAGLVELRGELRARKAGG